LEVEGVAAGGRAAAAHVGYFVNFVMPMLKTIHTVVTEKPYRNTNEKTNDIARLRKKSSANLLFS
jgi:hypothetical protein